MKDVFVLGSENIGDYTEVSWTNTGSHLRHDEEKSSTLLRGRRNFRSVKNAMAFAKKTALHLGEGTTLRHSEVGGYNLIVTWALHLNSVLHPKSVTCT